MSADTPLSAIAPTLLPCPFCGGEAEERWPRTLIGNEAVQCKSCHAIVPCKAERAEWNRRITPSQSRPINEREENALKEFAREMAVSFGPEAGEAASDAAKAFLLSTSLPSSTRAFTREDAAKLVERKAKALTEEYCHGDSGPGGYTWTNKEAEWQVILLDELAEEIRRG